MAFCRLFFFVLLLGAAFSAPSATVLVLQFYNKSPYPDLNWVGEGVAETLRTEFSAANQIVYDRDSRAEVMRRLSLRPDADFTKATLIRLGQTLDANYLCYGSYDAILPSTKSLLKDSSVQISAHLINLKKLHDAPDVLEAGALSELSRLQEHLAWQLLKYLDPRVNLPVEQFLAPQKLTRVDAEESYVRGLLSLNKSQQQKWFMQAAALDPHFASPVFELGKLGLESKNYRQALRWFQQISPNNPRYPEARFKMGLSAYGAGDYTSSANYFREVLKILPMNEVYNNLAAAELHTNSNAAIEDLEHALDGDQADPACLFNLGIALLKSNKFDEAAKQLQDVVDRDPNDTEARSLLERARRHEVPSQNDNSLTAGRLKTTFDQTAYRQLKAMVQPKSGQ